MHPAEVRLRAHLYRGNAIRDIEVPPPVVNRLILQGSLVQLYGKWKSGKSFIALDLALRLACEMDWHGVATQSCPTLYVVAEGSPGYPARIEAWLAYHSLRDLPETFALVTVPVNLLDRAGDLEALIAIGREMGARFVTFDTLARCMLGGDENSTRDMSMAIAGADYVRECLNATALLVHHPGKDESKGGRGSSSLPGAIDTELKLTGTDNKMILHVANQRHLPSGHRILFELKEMGESMVPVCTGGSEALAVLTGHLSLMMAILHADSNGGLTAREWHETIPGVSRATFYRYVRRIVDEGLALPQQDPSDARVTRYVPAPSHVSPL